MPDAFFDDILDQATRTTDGPVRLTPPAVDRLGALARDAPAPVPPPELVGRPCAAAPAPWHADAAVRASGRDDEVGRVRVRYHLRWLAHLCSPGVDRFRPTVSVIIPSYNAADLAVAAVESCLAQEPAPAEIVVVDDGSTEATADALARFGSSIALIRQLNQGVPTARNNGLAAARGDFIHFLDADDALLPGALADKVAAFGVIPDADLCFSPTQDVGADGRPRRPRLPPPDGGPRCATVDFLYAVVRGPALLPSAAMLPRWRALAADPFDPTLRRTEDRRYFFRLAQTSAKAIAIGRPLVRRRMDTGGVLGPGRPQAEYKAVAILMNLIDCVETPRLWRYAPFVLLSRWYRIVDVEDDRLDALRQTLGERLAELGDGKARDGLSPLLLIHGLALALAWFDRTRPRLTVAGLARHTAVRETLLAAAATAAAPGSADRAYWLGDGPCHGSMRPLIDAYRALGDDPRFIADLRRLNRPAPSLVWRLVERLAPSLGAARASGTADALARALGPSLRIPLLYRVLADAKGDWLVGDGERWPPKGRG